MQQLRSRRFGISTWTKFMPDTREAQILKLADLAERMQGTESWPQDGNQFWDVGFVPESVEMIAKCAPLTIASAMRVISAARNVGYAPELGRGGYFGGQALAEALREWDQQ